MCQMYTAFQSLLQSASHETENRKQRTENRVQAWHQLSRLFGAPSRALFPLLASPWCCFFLLWYTSYWCTSSGSAASACPHVLASPALCPVSPLIGLHFCSCFQAPFCRSLFNCSWPTSKSDLAKCSLASCYFLSLFRPSRSLRLLLALWALHWRVSTWRVSRSLVLVALLGHTGSESLPSCTP